jgi:hypothetical protein
VLHLVLCVVALCVALLHSVLIKEVMGWQYFADVASMIFFEKKQYRSLRFGFFGVMG